MDKSTRWAFTAYKDQWHLFSSIPPLVAEWGWQEEVCPKTQRQHYQGFIRTQRQVRFSQLQKSLPGVHIEPAKNWDALVNYCRKPDTSVTGTQVHQITSVKSLTMAQALIKIAENRPNDLDFSKCESAKDFRELYLLEFDQSVASILKVDENLVGLYSQPQYERAYVKWRSVWVKKCTDRQTDRQTESSPLKEEAKTEA